MRRRREHRLAEVPDNRLRKEGILIGYTAYRAPLITWWNPETSSWGLFELPR